MEFFANFAWALPSSFSDPIQRCRFEYGDVLYNTRAAYSEDAQPWSELKPTISYSIQVTYPPKEQPIQATPLSKDTPGGKPSNPIRVFQHNWHSRVRFDLIDYASNTTTFVETTQGRLYTLLWKGSLTCLPLTSPVPLAPLSLSDVQMALRACVASLDAYLNNSGIEGRVFVIAHDPTNLVSLLKLGSIVAGLRATKPHRISLVPANFCPYLADRVSPTISFECFCVGSAPHDDIKAHLKKVLYKPDLNRQAETDRFNLARHGCLINIKRPKQGGLW